MRLIQSVNGAAEGVPPVIAAAGIVALQLLVAIWLGHGQGWPGGLATGLCLLAVETVLYYGVAHAIGGRFFALVAGLVFVLAPVVLAKHYFVTGGPSLDYKVVYRHDVLPGEYGVSGRAAIVCACLLLGSGWLMLARVRFPAWTVAAASGVAAAAAVLVFPRAWPALAAPVLAAAITRAWRATLAAAATAGAGLLALVLFRYVPHVPLGWHQIGLGLAGVREFTWSRRILEYLPIAGLIGLARRSPVAAAFFGTTFVGLIVFPLARPIELSAYLLVIVPALPAYWLLASSLGYLVPRPIMRRATSTAATGA